MMDDVRPTGRERRLLGAILVLGTVVLFFVAINLIGAALASFSDILLAFFLAWLLAFIISPLVTRIAAAIPGLPRVVATVLIYTVIVIGLVVIGLVVAQALATSITQFVASIPEIRSDIDTIVAPLQGWLDSIGLGQVDVAAQALALLDNLDDIAGSLIAPLQSFAVASVGAIGLTLIIFFLSIYMVIDRDPIMAFLYRLVPPSYAEEARLLQSSVARSFGGFLRGQALMGIVYFAIALGASVLLGLPLAALTSVSAGDPDGDPVLRAVRVVGAAGHRRPAVPAGRAAPAVDHHGHRVVRGDEHHAASDHAGRGRHPPDRRPRLGAHRLADRGHPGCDLRHPGRGRRLGLLPALPASDLGGPDGR